MKLFRRKKYVRSEGKGSDEIETFQKEIKVLNVAGMFAAEMLCAYECW